MRFFVNFKIIKFLFLIFLVSPFQLFAIENAVVEGDSIGVDSVVIVNRLAVSPRTFIKILATNEDLKVTFYSK